LAPMTRSKGGAARRGTGRLPVSRGAGARRASRTSSLPAGEASEPAAPPVELPPLGMAVASSWGWRIMAVVTMVAFGLCITFFLDGHTVFGVLWVVIAVAWAFFTNKLRLLHLAWDRS